MRAIHLLSCTALALAATTALTLGTGAATASPLTLEATPSGASSTQFDAATAGDWIVMLELPEEATGDRALTTSSARTAVATATASAASRFSAQGVDVRAQLDTLGAVTAADLTPEQVAALEADPAVASVERDARVSIDEEQADAPWGLDRVDQEAAELDKTYTYEGTGEGVTAFIIDTGIRATHKDLAGRVGEGHTVVQDGEGTNDCQGHGTHVAATVGGTTYGVAKGVKLEPVRVLECDGSGSVLGILAAMEWVMDEAAATEGPDVANMSLGGTKLGAMDEAVDRMSDAGVVTAVAAGNDTEDACQHSPAASQKAITVGATDNTDVLAEFSNFGECVDILAPGVDITSAWKDSDDATKTISGTSMASPHVAGAAALALQKNPEATADQVKETLTTTATKDAIDKVNGSPNLLLNALKAFQA